MKITGSEQHTVISPPSPFFGMGEHGGGQMHKRTTPKTFRRGPLSKPACHWTVYCRLFP
jgi:hypothetical protein